MDDKLEKYRKQKKRQEFLSRMTDKFLAMVVPVRKKENKTEEVIQISAIGNSKEDSEEEDILYQDSESDFNPESESNQPSEPITKSQIFTYFVYICFWSTCWLIAIELKFGIVFLLLSALFGIYFNTRTEPKRKHEISAYSVFNKNCESIDGTLKAEQFEREIRYGSMSVR